MLALAADAVHAATSVGPLVAVVQVVAGVVCVAGTAMQVPVGTAVQTPEVHDWSCDVLTRSCAVVCSKGVENSDAVAVVTSIVPMAPLSIVPPTGSQNQRLPSAPVASAPVLTRVSPAPLPVALRAQLPEPPGGQSREETAREVFARAVEHGDAHVIKFADTAIDVFARTGNRDAIAAALRAAELIGP